MVNTQEQKLVPGKNNQTLSQTAKADKQNAHQSKANVSMVERVLSIAGGTALLVVGVQRKNLVGGGLAIVGGDLIYRGISGQCWLYRRLGVNTAAAKPGGLKVQHTTTVMRTPQELYHFWHNFENLPSFMKHLESVKITSAKNSHWVAKAPAGAKVEWDAEIVEERENEFIAWRSLPNADVDNRGTVRFTPATGGRGTVVEVIIQYNLPGGKLGSIVAKLFGEEPDQQVKDDLRQFKMVMEAGETAKTDGQPAGRRK